MKNKLCIIVALINMFLITGIISATDIPFISSRVNDYAGVLSTEAESLLENTLKEFEEKTSNQVVVLTIKDLDGESIESYSIKVAEKWRIGQENKDNGVILLMSLNDRKVRIEVGYGLEEYLTDAVASIIIRNEIIPRFKVGAYEKGLVAGTVAILQAISQTYDGDNSTNGVNVNSANNINNINIDKTSGNGLLIGIYIVALILSFLAICSKGCASVVLFFICIPMFLMFPLAIWPNIGGFIGVGNIILMIFLKVFLNARFKNSNKYNNFRSTMSSVLNVAFFTLLNSSSNNRSSGRFGGGGGSFGGGGASGSW